MTLQQWANPRNWINPATPLDSVESKIAELCDICSSYLLKPALANIEKACYFARDAHLGQTRRSGEPYVMHPIEVARSLALEQLDDSTIAAAILHDTIEDTQTTLETLQVEFGAEVALLVDGVTKIGQIRFQSKEHAEAENFRKMLFAMSKDLRVILIKLADRLHNMETLGNLSRDSQIRISQQTLEIYAPIAVRVGAKIIASRLEDLCLKHLKPKTYETLQRSLKRHSGNQRNHIAKICTRIEKHLHEHGIETISIIGREKNIYGIYDKMKRQRIKFEQVHDIYAIRVVVNSNDDCYRALGVIHDLYKPIPTQFDDYIAIPKANGYQSLHTAVFETQGKSLEVQIRTQQMHRLAEIGLASHWTYKVGQKSTASAKESTTKWLTDLLKDQENTANSAEFLEHLKVDLYPDQIYVFTKDGGIKKLPEGASVLDLAFAIHTDIGKRCRSALVNDLPRSLHNTLNNGDRVEIDTSYKPTVSPLWLNYLVTSKARSSVRAYLNKLKRNEARRLGKKLLMQAMKLQTKKAVKLDKERRNDLLKLLNISDWNLLLEDIGKGNRIAQIVARQCSSDNQGQEENDMMQYGKPILINGAEGILLNFAKCCYPIPGDKILGVVTKGRGLVIHSCDCHNIRAFQKNPESLLPVSWSKKIDQSFPVGLHIEAENLPGVLANVANTIARHDSNINNMTVAEHGNNISLINIEHEVMDKVHLNEVCLAIQALPEVFKISRERS